MNVLYTNSSTDEKECSCHYNSRVKLEIVIRRQNLVFHKKKPTYKGQQFINVLPESIKQKKGTLHLRKSKGPYYNKNLNLY